MLNSSNDRYRDFLNVTSWHNAGYTGSRGLSATAEPYDVSTSTEHSVDTSNAFFEIAPDRKLIGLGSLLSSQYKLDYFQAIKDNKIDTMFESLAVSTTKETYNAGLDPYLEEVKDYFTHFVAMGNYSGAGFNSKATSELTYGVGACMLMVDNTEVRKHSYSSESVNHLDFMSFAGINSFAGTSCATPVLTGMCALVNDFFIDKTGEPLSSEMMYQFIKDNCIDLAEDGKDKTTGHGIFVLPNIEDINISKYTDIGENDVLDQFEDKKDISSWAEESVRFCVENGVINGDGTNFNPKDTVTREQIAVMLHNYSKLNK